MLRLSFLLVHGKKMRMVSELTNIIQQAFGDLGPDNYQLVSAALLEMFQTLMYVQNPRSCRTIVALNGPLTVSKITCFLEFCLG